jgi:hypothetical protein
MVHGTWYRVPGVGYRVSGVGCRVSGVGSRVFLGGEFVGTFKSVVHFIVTPILIADFM